MFKLFKLPSAAKAARQELDRAELELLEAHTRREHAEAVVEYQEKRVARLRAFVEAK